jgi:hypothetical protein
MLRPSEIHIEPRIVGRAVDAPGMRDLRAAVRDRFRVSDQTARSFAERLLTHAVQRLGAEYLNEMAARIELAFKLRDQAATILEQVIGPEALSPDEAAANLDAAFREIKSNIDAITDPSTFAKARAKDQTSEIEIEFLPPEERAREEQLTPEPARKSARAGRHVEQVKVLSRVFEAMAVGRRKAMRRAADLAPHELWRAVSSETGPAREGLQGGGLDRNIAVLIERVRSKGMSENEADTLEAAVRELSLERARSQRLPGTAEAALRAEGVRNLVSRLEQSLADDQSFKKDFPRLAALGRRALRERLTRLRDLAAGDRYMELLAAENPRQLLEFFENSGARTSSALRAYIRGRMVTHFSGLVGEFTAAFRLGDEGVIFIKGPDYDITVSGTDLSGVTRDGRVLLIDNKALNAAEAGSVTSLIRNISKNIGDDAAAGKFGGGQDPLIGNALARLNSATQEIRAATKNLSSEEIAAPDIQEQITAICTKYRIERVVTNAGGRVRGLSKGLKDAGILFEDITAPIQKNPRTP